MSTLNASTTADDKFAAVAIRETGRGLTWASVHENSPFALALEEIEGMHKAT